jgi:hypothetical protein
MIVSRLLLRALVFAIVSIIVVQSPAAAQNPKRKPQGFVEAMFSDVTLSQRYRPIADPDRYLTQLGNLSERTEPQLQSALSDLERMRQIDGRNWQEIQRARQNSKFRLPLDQPMYVARMYDAATQKQREIDKIDDEEGAAFRTRFGFGLREGFFAHTPDQQGKVNQWRLENRHVPYDKRRQEVQDRFRQRMEEISTEYRNQTDPGEKYLDQLQRETLARYQRILVVQRTLRAELDRRHNVSGEVPPEKPNQARAGTLVLSSPQAGYELKVGQVADVRLTVSGGKPSYELTVKRTEGDVIAELALSQPGETSFPVSFAKENTYTVQVKVRDTNLPVNETTLTLVFRVTDDKPAESESPKPPVPPKPPITTKPQETAKPPAKSPIRTKPQETTKPPAKPETPQYSPWRLAAGTYQANLWPGLAWNVHDRKLPKPGVVPPLPVTLTFQADGQFTGSIDWNLADAEKDFSGHRPGATISSRVTASVSGKADWTTGRIDWKLEQGKLLHQITEPTVDGKGIEKTTWTVEFANEFSGWQFEHPIFAVELEKSLAHSEEKFGPPPPDALELSGFPKFRIDARGTYVISERGFGGIPANGPQRGRYDTMPGPGGYASLTLSKSDHEDVYPDRTRTDSDLTTLRDFWAEYSSWFLRISDQKVEPEPSPPAKPTPIRGELAAFGLWPRGEVTVKPGEAFDMDAMGVLLNDPYEAVNLTNTATWTLPDGLVRGPDGKVKATKPGTYAVSVSINRPDGRVMNDTIRIIVK